MSTTINHLGPDWLRSALDMFTDVTLVLTGEENNLPSLLRYFTWYKYMSSKYLAQISQHHLFLVVQED